MHRHIFARMSLLGTLPALCAACLIAASAAPVTASSPDTEARPERRVSETVDPDAIESSVAAGDSIGVSADSETGEATASDSRPPTGALSAPLAKALDRSTDGLHFFELANGGRGMHLDGRFQHVLMVRVKADGSLETVCVNNAHDAEQFLKRSAAEADTQPQEK